MIEHIESFPPKLQPLTDPLASRADPDTCPVSNAWLYAYAAHKSDGSKIPKRSTCSSPRVRISIRFLWCFAGRILPASVGKLQSRANAGLVTTKTQRHKEIRQRGV